MTSPIAALQVLALECADPEPVATFWAAVLPTFLVVEGSGLSSLNQFATRLAAEQRKTQIVALGHF